MAEDTRLNTDGNQPFSPREFYNNQREPPREFHNNQREPPREFHNSQREQPRENHNNQREPNRRADYITNASDGAEPGKQPSR